MSIRRVNGLNYHFEVTGSGPPLLLLHGFTGSLCTWAELAPALSERMTIVAVDLPGHGRSDAPARSGRYAQGQVSADLVELMDACGRRRFHLLGYSMGGRQALALAQGHPERIQSLVLESASPGLATEAERAARRCQDEALARQIEREGVEHFVRRWERLPLFASQRRLPADTRAELRRQRMHNRSAGLAGSLRGAGAGAQQPYWHRLSQLTAPTLLLTGALDAKFCAIARRMRAANPAFGHSEVAGAGHCVHLEQPRQFQRLVLDFLMAREGDHADF